VVSSGGGVTVTELVVSEVDDKVVLPLSILLLHLMNHTNDTYLKR
jgi:hypothetical protein